MCVCCRIILSLIICLCSVKIICLYEKKEKKTFVILIKPWLDTKTCWMRFVHIHHTIGFLSMMFLPQSRFSLMTKYWLAGGQTPLSCTFVQMFGCIYTCDRRGSSITFTDGTLQSRRLLQEQRSERKRGYKLKRYDNTKVLVCRKYDVQQTLFSQRCMTYITWFCSSAFPEDWAQNVQFVLFV